MPASETVSVVVPTCGRPDSLRMALGSLIAVSHPAECLQVIVVDDSGGDPRIDEVVNTCATAGVAPLIVRERGVGAAGARNRGAAVAEGDFLIFCDDDIVVGPDHVRRHLETHGAFPDALVNGISEFTPAVLAQLASTPFGRYRIALERRFEAEADGRALGHGCVETALVTARNLSLRRDLFQRVGGFDEAFPFAGAEDQDLSIRARRAGATLVRDHGIRVLNNESVITFDGFCTREERSATTAVVLADKLPDEAAGRPIILRNRPISRGDSAVLVATKGIKSALSQPIPLRLLHALVAVLARRRLPDRWLWRWYEGVLALHIFRGVRRGLFQFCRPEPGQSLTPPSEDRQADGQPVPPAE